MNSKKISRLSVIIFHTYAYYTIINGIVIPHIINNYNRQAFLYPIFFVLFGAIIFFVYNPKKYSIKQILDKSTVFKYILILYLILYSVILVGISTIVIKQFYPLTGEYYFYLFFLIVGCFMAFYGIGTIINLSSVLFSIFPVLILLPAFIAEKEINHSLVMPFDLSWNLLPLLSILFIPMDMILITYESENLEKNTTRKTLMISLIAMMTLASINLYASTITFSIGFLKIAELPGFIIYDNLKISKNFDNYDIILLFFVTVSTSFKLGYNINLIKQVLKLKENRGTYISIVLIGMLLMSLVYIYRIDLTNYSSLIMYILLTLVSIFFIYQLLVRRQYEKKIQ